MHLKANSLTADFIWKKKVKNVFLCGVFEILQFQNLLQLFLAI